MLFICFVQKGEAGSCWSLRTIFLCNAPSFTCNFVTHTHNSSHTTCLTSRSSTTSFVFPSFPVPATTFVAHFWTKLTCGVIRSFNLTLRCGKSARHCGAKHISKSTCTKHFSVGVVLDVEMFKKWRLPWRQAHSQVKMLNAHHSRSTFGR